MRDRPFWMQHRSGSGSRRMFSAEGRVGKLLVGSLMLGLLAIAPGALAATRSMTGSLGVINPSNVGGQFLFDSGPGVFGAPAGPYPVTDGFKTISVDGATAGTFVGRKVTIPANVFSFSGGRVRAFPAFPNVAQTSRTFVSTHPQAMLMNGAGALADCPGPGCTSAGSGTAISWCPPLSQPATPAPGTFTNRVGDWDCPSWPAGAGGGNRFMRIGVSNSPAAPHFGGTFSLLRNMIIDVWRVLVQPGTAGTPAEVSRTFKNLVGMPWPGGLPNFQFVGEMSNRGPRILASLGTDGKVTATFGCVNGQGTVGAPFSPGNPAGLVGSNCGTATTVPPPFQNWGFKLTTGTVSGSDPYPFFNATTALGTPFAANVVANTPYQGFFFTRMGNDSVNGTSRNLVLVGGGATVDPGSGNSFFRITDLRLNLVPEPALAVGLLVGVGALVVARRAGARRGGSE